MEVIESGARREVEIELRGKKYTIRELTMDDYGDIENFIRSKNAKIYRDSAVDVEAKERDAMIIKIIQRPLTNEEITAEMTCMDTVRFFTFLAMRHNPGITRDGMKDVIGLDNIRDVETVLNGLSGDDQESNTENPPQPEVESP